MSGGTVAAVAVGAVTSAYGAISSSEASASASKYNAQVAANNQTIANQNATLAAQSGEAQAGQEEQKTRATVGAVKAAQAANGVDVNSGSADAVQKSAAELGEQSAINIRASAARQAYGYETQSMNFAAQSELDKAQASQDLTSGYINGGSSLLNGAGTAAMDYQQLSKGKD